MKPIKIVSDSTVQLSKEEQEKYEITIISLIAMIEEELYYDPDCKKVLESLLLPKQFNLQSDSSLNLGQLRLRLVAVLEEIKSRTL